MEKIKFGMQLAVLMLAFPVWFLVETKDINEATKINRANEQPIEVQKTSDAGKETAGTGLMPASTMLTVNI
jgi:hypothetical protein